MSSRLTFTPRITFPRMGDEVRPREQDACEPDDPLVEQGAP